MNMCSHPQNQLKQMSNSGLKKEKNEAFHDLANAGNEILCRRMESDILVIYCLQYGNAKRKKSWSRCKTNTFVTFSFLPANHMRICWQLIVFFFVDAINRFVSNCFQGVHIFHASSCSTNDKSYLNRSKTPHSSSQMITAASASLKVYNKAFGDYQRARERETTFFFSFANKKPNLEY